MEESKILEKYNPQNNIQISNLYKQLLSHYFGINSIVIKGMLDTKILTYYAYYGKDDKEKILTIIFNTYPFIIPFKAMHSAGFYGFCSLDHC